MTHSTCSSPSLLSFSCYLTCIEFDFLIYSSQGLSSLLFKVLYTYSIYIVDCLHLYLHGIALFIMPYLTLTGKEKSGFL